MPGPAPANLQSMTSLSRHLPLTQRRKAVMHSLDSLIFDEARTAQPDVFVLKDRLQGLFSRYGQVARLDLVRADQGQVGRIMCFLRMGTPEQEQAVVDALGMGRFGGDLVMVLMLQPAQTAAAPWSREAPASPNAAWH